jgi:hypothetical protein
VVIDIVNIRRAIIKTDNHPPVGSCHFSLRE